MIQRIQSLFLAFSITISITTFFVPFCEKLNNEGQIQSLSLLGNSVQKSSHELILCNLLVLVVAITAVFNYKKRGLQMKLCRIGSLLSIALLVLAFYASESLVGGGKPLYLVGIYINALQPVLFFIARRYIHKDDLLVRSADRIR